jgi:hypothetical protein
MRLYFDSNDSSYDPYVPLERDEHSKAHEASDLLRDRLLEQQRHLDNAPPDSLREENLRLREQLLCVRDEIIGREAELGEALGRVAELEARLDGLLEARKLLESRAGRLLRTYARLRAMLRTQ